MRTGEGAYCSTLPSPILEPLAGGQIELVFRRTGQPSLEELLGSRSSRRPVPIYGRVKLERKGRGGGLPFYASEATVAPYGIKLVWAVLKLLLRFWLGGWGLLGRKLFFFF